MSNKRYYWLKLKDNFFEQDDIKIIESIPNGKDYIIFYLKLLCKSLKSDGRLLYKGIIPYTPEMLATITGTNIDIVNGAIEKFKLLGMVEILDDGALYMLGVQEMTGSETDSTLRSRKCREVKKDTLPISEQVLQCNTMQQNATEMQHRDRERDREKSIEKDKEIEPEKESATDVVAEPPSQNPESIEDTKETIPYQEIKELFNNICISYSKVRDITERRRKAIRARFNDGYTLEDFKKAFEIAEESDFLKGNNGRNWKADFDWFTNESNLTKTLEGKYDNRKQQPVKQQNPFSFNDELEEKYGI